MYISNILKRWFKRQLELAEETKLPMFLHMRAAGEDFIRTIVLIVSFTYCY